MPALREQGIELSAWHELDADDQAGLSERFRTGSSRCSRRSLSTLVTRSPMCRICRSTWRSSSRSTRRARTLRAGEGPEHVAQMAPDRRHRSFRAARGSHRRTSRPAVSWHGGAGAPRLPRHPQCRSFRCARRGRRPPVGVEYELRRRRFGRATRLEVDASMTDEVLDPARRIRSRPVGGLRRSNAARSDLVQRDRRHRTPGSALARVEGRCRPTTAARRRTGRHLRRDPSW